MANRLSPDFLKSFGSVSKAMGDRSETHTKRSVLESKLASVNKKISASLQTGYGDMKELNEEKNSIVLDLATINEAKMENKEVLAAAKKLAENGKDEKAKSFGQGLVDYYEKNRSFTPDQVSGLQNIMKNASFQLAKEETELNEATNFKSEKVFDSEKEANAFLEKNPEYGMTHEKSGKVYVAKNDDLGEAKETPAWHYSTYKDYVKACKEKGVQKMPEKLWDELKKDSMDESVDLEEARAMDMKDVEALNKIKDLGELKTKAIEIVKGSGAKASKKASLENNITKANTVDKVLSIVWNMVLAGDKLGTIGSKWGKHSESVELDEEKKDSDDDDLDPVNKKAVKKDFDDRKDKDIDNDGDVDDSDEYLHKRRKAISKAIKESIRSRR